MALGILAEALARIEHKLDALLKALLPPGHPIQPLHFIGQSCPVCLSAVDFTVDVQKGVVVRRCGCKTGKVPSMIPLMPVEAPRNVNPSVSDSPSEWSADSSGPSDSSRGKDR